MEQQTISFVSFQITKQSDIALAPQEGILCTLRCVQASVAKFCFDDLTVQILT